LKKRGLAGVRLASSDQHEVLKTVIGHVLERLEPVAPKVCRFLEDATIFSRVDSGVRKWLVK
jgi:hypothetical protein